MLRFLPPSAERVVPRSTGMQLPSKLILRARRPLERPTVTRPKLPPLNLRAVAVAGTVAGVAYLAEMAVDLPLLDHNADDLVFLGAPFVGNNHALAKPVGTAVHAANAANLALAYALLAEPRLPGPPWWRGALFANIENALLYPLTKLTDRHHPAVRDGRLAPYWNRPAFLQSVLRHVAYGAVLGALYHRLRQDHPGA